MGQRSTAIVLDGACLSGQGCRMRRRSRGVPDELAVRELVRRPLFRPAFSLDHRWPRSSPLDWGGQLTCLRPASRAPPGRNQSDLAPPSVPAILLAAVCRRKSRLQPSGNSALYSSAAVVLLACATPHTLNHKRQRSSPLRPIRSRTSSDKASQRSQFRRPGFAPSCERRVSVILELCRLKAPWA